MLTSADVMTADVVSVEPDTPVRDIAQLLYTRRISGVPVVEQGRLIGIVSEGDLIGHAAAIGEQRRSWWLSAFMDDSLSARDYAKTHGRTARDVMTSNVVTVEETTTLAEIAKTLERHRIKRVPVVRNDTIYLFFSIFLFYFRSKTPTWRPSRLFCFPRCASAA